MRRINPLAIIFLVFGVFLFVGDWYIKNHMVKKTSKEVARTVEFTGTVEVRQEAIQFQIPGKVEEVLVTVGDIVEKDQTLARLENLELVDEMALLKKKVQDLEAELETLLSGLSPKKAVSSLATKTGEQAVTKDTREQERQREIAGVEGAVAHARDEMESMRLEMERYEKLFKEGTAPEKELFKAKSDFETAKAQVKEAEDMMHVVMKAPPVEKPPVAKIALVKAAPQISLAHPSSGSNGEIQLRLTQAKTALAQAKDKLRLAEVVAPFSGYVMERNLQPGEFVVSGTQVMTIGKLETVWVWGYVDAEDGASIKKGMQVLVSSKKRADKIFSGKVVHVAAPKAVPNGMEKGAVKFHVKVAIPNPEVQLQPGMQTHVKIELN